MGHVGHVPTTLENLGTKSIWFPPTFVTVIYIGLDAS